MWQIDGLNNESDVEQKFLYGFFTEPLPLGLELPGSIIQTKANLRPEFVNDFETPGCINLVCNRLIFY